LLGVGYWVGSRTDKTAPGPAPTVTVVVTERVPAEPAPPVETAAASDPVEDLDATAEPTATAAPGLTGSLPTTTAGADTAPATAAPIASASAAPAVGDFDKSAANAALGAAVSKAAACKQPGDPSGQAKVQVTFAPSGRVTVANIMGPPFAGTKTGGCIAMAFRSATVPPFAGDPQTVAKTVSIP
jgi:hypothetical protein